MTAPGRWSRSRARARWSELRIFVDRPLGVGLLIVSLWPLVALVSSLDVYRRPVVAVVAYLVTVALLAILWWRGRVGVGVAATVVCAVAVVVLNLALTFQVPEGEPAGAALWLHGWGVAIPMVLAFSRPIEEPLTVLAALAATNVVAAARGGTGVAALHDVPLHVGIPVAVTVSGLVLVGALRRSVATAHRDRERTAFLVERERLVEAGRRRLARWEEEAAALLQSVGDGDLPVDGPTRAAAGALALAARAALSPDESILWAHLPGDPTAQVIVRDLDVGHRLRPVERTRLVQVVSGLSRLPGRIEVTLQPAADPGEPVREALVIVAATGLAVPGHSGAGILTVESPRRWFLELTLECDDGQSSR